jgi:hypothetical protein
MINTHPSRDTRVRPRMIASAISGACCRATIFPWEHFQRNAESDAFGVQGYEAPAA